MNNDIYRAFMMDFDIADMFGLAAIKDTYKRAFNEWKNNVEYVTQLTIVLNHKIWEHYYAKDKAETELYDNLWREIDSWCCTNLEGSDLVYYYRTTD